ncbi:hypothetical protein GCM10026987_28530 [Belliella aquatica]|uniref:Caspase domain-containing protein n=2 Tax=Belliella aquatica TaxID=1323734 RepID=A0ABQ1MTL6_9BACT|nr:hypothetical protein GCM10010993_25990 [Belliella aquatica]
MALESTNRKPKAYALCVGKNEFIFDKSLRKAVRDAKYWEREFLRRFKYDLVITLTENETRYQLFIAAIWQLANLAKSGDVVAITIATHGEIKQGINSFTITPNVKISEDEFYFLLKAFKPGVRVFVLTDICHGGTFVEPNNNREAQGNFVNRVLDIIKHEAAWDLPKVEAMLKNQCDIPITASIAHLSSSADNNQIVDGILVDLIVSEFWIYGYTLDWYTFEGFRDEIAKLYESRLKTDEIGFAETITESTKHCSAYSKVIKDFVVKYKFASLKSLIVHIAKSQNKSLLKDLYIELITNIHLLSAYPNESKEETQENLKNVIQNIVSWYSLIETNAPIINYAGVPTDDFKNKYIFQK